MIFTLTQWQLVDIVVFSLIVGMWLPYVVAFIVSRPSVLKYRKIERESRAIVAEMQEGL